MDHNKTIDELTAKNEELLELLKECTNTLKRCADQLMIRDNMIKAQSQEILLLKSHIAHLERCSNF